MCPNATGSARGPPKVELTGDTVGRVFRSLMLPYPNYGPAVLGKPAVGLLIPFLVSRELLTPPFGIRARERRMLRTRVPEAAVDEHDHLRPRENDVGAPSAIELKRPLNAEAISTSMEGRSKRELRRRMRPGRAAHPVANPG